MLGEAKGRLGPYLLLGELGRGGAARVYRARNEKTGRECALKVLAGVPDPDAMIRFRREAEALARVGTGVTTIHETGVEDGRLHVAMELMPGGSLADRAPLPWREAVAIVLEVARTLGRCAALGLVHRDVKPANILMDGDGRPRLSDFGCVRDLAATRLTETGTVLGTLDYMAPEQLDGRTAGPAADVYALGVTLHELVTGGLPYEGKSPIALIAAIRSSSRPGVARTAGAPAALDRVLDRALAFEARDRYPDGAAFAVALEGVLAERAESWARPLVVLAIIASAAVAVTVLRARHTAVVGPAVSPVVSSDARDPDDLPRARVLELLRSSNTLGPQVIRELDVEASRLSARPRADASALASETVALIGRAVPTLGHDVDALTAYRLIEVLEIARRCDRGVAAPPTLAGGILLFTASVEGETEMRSVPPVDDLELIVRGVELTGNEDLAHAVGRVVVKAGSKDRPLGERLMRRIVAAVPSCATSHHRLGDALKDSDERFEEHSRALELPDDDPAMRYWTILTVVAGRMRRGLMDPEAALALVDRTESRRKPGAGSPVELRAGILLRLGRREEAASDLERVAGEIARVASVRNDPEKVEMIEAAERCRRWAKRAAEDASLDPLIAEIDFGASLR